MFVVNSSRELFLHSVDVMTRKESADVILEYSFMILLKLTFANEIQFFFSILDSGSVQENNMLSGIPGTYRRRDVS